MESTKSEEDNVRMDTPPRKRQVVYGVEDHPHFLLWPVFGFQQIIVCISGTLSIPFLVTSYICADGLLDVRAKLMSITFFMCGVATILQDTLGIRLPIIQGGSHTFIPPIAAMMALEKWRCPSEPVPSNTTQPWEIRMREIQGNLMLASITQVIIGLTGLVGFLLRFIGPLTIAPTIALIGISLSGVVIRFSQPHWGIAMLTVALILLFCLFLSGIKIPTPAFKRSKGCHISRYPLFQVAPILLGVAVSWLLSYILTETDVFTSNSTLPAYRARTDVSIDVLNNAPWFYFPYPLQFGIPTISAAGYIGLLAATISSVIESMGDYYACARLSEAPPPPPHAINRGIAIEGFSSIISGLVGAGNATTSYSGNIGEIAVTKVASRRVFQCAGVILIICGVIGKFGAVITLIPDPVIGGLNTVSLGLVTAVGMSALQYCDMSSSRNLTIIGVSFMLGIAVPQYLESNPDAIDTGSKEFDQVLNVLLGTAMFVGGILGCILDNIVPGTLEERGMLAWRKAAEGSTDSKDYQRASIEMYDLPYVSKLLRRIGCCRYVPFMPGFSPDLCCSCKSHADPHPVLHVYEQPVILEERL
ncbi:solute carrier family 23 member 2-like [Gigantopelta aegis]|uniref:solute carrier family 23 member 2-like n=1 Tax=Gigantopelta aegis TaxID=1735272 RepID=UPI001B88925A|nr:solute carrier family 23 member 2-like [Gigantopelta aegis]